MPKRDDHADWPVRADMRVTDPDAILVLWYPSKRQHLKPFIGKSSGLAEAAQMLGIKKTAMSYWIGRLLKVGLIRVCGFRIQPRHRTPLYRCVADRLRVHVADLPLASHESVFDVSDERWHPQTRLALARSVARQAPYLDLVVESSHPGGMEAGLLLSRPGAPPDDYIYYRGRLYLTAQERDKLRADLDALWDRYTALSDRAAKRSKVLVHLISVPEPGR